MASTLDLLKRLIGHEVEFVIVGGVAGVLHGSSLVTRDLDVCAAHERKPRSHSGGAFRPRRRIPNDLRQAAGVG